MLWTIWFCPCQLLTPAITVDCGAKSTMPKAPRTSRYVVVDEGTGHKRLGLDGRCRRVHLEDMDFRRKWEGK